MTEQQPTYTAAPEPTVPRGFVRLMMDDGRTVIVHADSVACVLPGTVGGSEIHMHAGTVLHVRAIYEHLVDEIAKAQEASNG